MMLMVVSGRISRYPIKPHAESSSLPCLALIELEDGKQLHTLCSALGAQKAT